MSKAPTISTKPIQSNYKPAIDRGRAGAITAMVVLIIGGGIAGGYCLYAYAGWQLPDALACGTGGGILLSVIGAVVILKASQKKPKLYQTSIGHQSQEDINPPPPKLNFFDDSDYSTDHSPPVSPVSYKKGKSKVSSYSETSSSNQIVPITPLQSKESQIGAKSKGSLSASESAKNKQKAQGHRKVQSQTLPINTQSIPHSAEGSASDDDDFYESAQGSSSDDEDGKETQAISANDFPNNFNLDELEQHGKQELPGSPQTPLQVSPQTLSNPLANQVVALTPPSSAHAATTTTETSSQSIPQPQSNPSAIPSVNSATSQISQPQNIPLTATTPVTTQNPAATATTQVHQLTPPAPSGQVMTTSSQAVQVIPTNASSIPPLSAVTSTQQPTSTSSNLNHVSQIPTASATAAGIAATSTSQPTNLQEKIAALQNTKSLNILAGEDGIKWLIKEIHRFLEKVLHKQIFVETPSSPPINLCYSTQPYLDVTWQLGKAISELNDHDVFQFTDESKTNFFEFTGSELKGLLNSLTVSFRPTEQLDRDKLHIMLTHGYNKHIDRVTQSKMAPFRNVSSDVFFFSTSTGTIVNRKSTENYRPTLIVTKNAPQFTAKKGLDAQAFLDTMKVILTDYLEECRKKQVDYPIFLGIGMGVFLGGDAKAKKHLFKKFAEILLEISFSYKDHFKQFVFADPGVIHEVVNAVMISSEMKNQWIVTPKSSIDVAILGSQENLKMALINPGDPSCVPGQYWEGGHLALEELIGRCSLLVLAQHPRCNPKVSNKLDYHEIGASTPTPEFYQLVNPLNDRRRHATLEPVVKINNSSRLRKLPVAPANTIFVFTPDRDLGIRLQIARQLVMMRPGEINWKSYDENTNLPFIDFDQSKHEMRIHFRNPAYANLLFNILSIDCSMRIQSEFFTHPAYGTFQSCLTVQGIPSIIKLVRDICQVASFSSIYEGLVREDVTWAFDLMAANEAHKTAPRSSLQVKLLRLHREGAAHSKQVLLPKKIIAPGVSQIVGAMTSLIVPGVNTYLDALLLRNIVNVEWQEWSFNLRFQKHEQAQQTFAVLYTGMVCTENGDQTPPKIVCLKTNKDTEKDKYNSYEGKISFFDPTEVAIFLRQICQLAPQDVSDMINNLIQGLKDSSFIKQVESESLKLLAGESAEKYQIKTKFNLELVPQVSQYKFSNELDLNTALPPLPPNAPEPKELLEIFKCVKSRLNASLLKEDHGGTISVDQAEKNLQKLVDVFTGEQTVCCALPSKDSEDHRLYKETNTLLLRHVLYLLNDLGPSHDLVAPVIGSMAVGGGHCATRYSQETSEAYNLLTANTTIPLYTDIGDIIKERLEWLPQCDVDMLRIFLKEIRSLQQEAFMKVYLQFSSQHPTSDHSHLRKKIAATLVKHRHFPGDKNSQYADAFAGLAAYATEVNILHLYDAVFNLPSLIDMLKQKFRSDRPNVGATKALIEYFKFHAPEAPPVQNTADEEDPKDPTMTLFGLAFDDDYMLVKDPKIPGADGKVRTTFLIQMLEHLCLIENTAPIQTTTTTSTLQT